LVADCNSILDRWRNHFSQLLNVHRVNYDNQTEVHTAELVPEPRVFEFELATEELKVTNHRALIKSHQKCLKQVVEQFPMRHKHIIFICQDELPEDWKSRSSFKMF